jgi:hypothetical protein
MTSASSRPRVSLPYWTVFLLAVLLECAKDLCVEFADFFAELDGLG